MMNKELRTPAAALTPAVKEWLPRQLRLAQDVPDALLMDAGWLDGTGRFTATAGCLFGADIGGTKVQSVLTDLNGTLIAEVRSTTPPEGGDAVLDLVTSHLSQMMLQTGAPLLAAGVGLPGTVHPVTGHLDRAPNLPGFDGRNMRALLSDRLGVPTAVENDVNFAALGEVWLGHGTLPAAAFGGLAFVALGTGIGMGLAWGDRILRGALGAAGEVAALPIGGNPFDPATRGCGALESVVSGAALVKDYRASGGTHAGQTLREITKDAQIDPALDAVMERLAQRTALAVLSIDAIVNPAVFAFGGGIGSQPALLARITAALAQALPDGHPMPDCRISQLGNRAGVFGAVRAARLAYADSLTA